MVCRSARSWLFFCVATARLAAGQIQANVHQSDEFAVVVDKDTKRLEIVKASDVDVRSTKKKIQPLFPGDMIDHKTGNGYNHGMLYLGSKTQAMNFARKFRPEALQDITSDGQYVIDFGPAAPGAGGDDVESGWWPNGVKVSRADIVNDGEWRWKDYRPFWIKIGPLSGLESIRRAFSLYHDRAGPGYGSHREYDFLRNNCHHFVAWCRYGDAVIADRVATGLSTALVLRDIEFPLPDNVFVQEGALNCEYGKDATQTWKVSGPGHYQIRVTRTSTGEDHTVGRVTVKNSAGSVQEDWKYRSDKGGFTNRFTSTAKTNEDYEVTVTGSSHCWDSIFMGCHLTTVAITITRSIDQQFVVV